MSSVPCDDRFTVDDATATTTASGVTWHFELLGWRSPQGTFARQLSTQERYVTQADLYGRVTVDTNPPTSTLSVDSTIPTSPVLRMTTTPVPQTGGTVTFTDGGTPIAGCTDVAVNTTTGITTCSPVGVSPGGRTFLRRHRLRRLRRRTGDHQGVPSPLDPGVGGSPAGRPGA